MTEGQLVNFGGLWKMLIAPEQYKLSRLALCSSKENNFLYRMNAIEFEIEGNMVLEEIFESF